MKGCAKFLIGLLVVAVIVGGYFYLRHRRDGSAPLPKRGAELLQFLAAPDDHQDWTVKALSRCEDAPFLMPTDGYIGFLWDDSFAPGHRHQGLDLFGGTEPGKTPVYAAYDGYLSRLPDWKSTVIIRVPQDPLQPDRQIWNYYTHMADRLGSSFISDAFPQGTSEKFVPAGTLLGYQGNYSADPLNPTGIHLHFSIVLSGSDGKYLNELDINNTLDPSPYFHLPLNGPENDSFAPRCAQAEGEQP